MNVDILAIGAHPDDVDLGVGGTLHKMAAAGYIVGIVDLTRGELSSRGTPAERSAEAEAAARILGVATRVNAELPDGELANAPEYRAKLLGLICEFCPKVILAHMDTDRHPDHRAAHFLTRDANFFAGVTRAAEPHRPHRADHVFYFHPYYQGASAPQFVIDISDHFEAKIEALKAFRSQFHNPGYEGHETFVASASFWDQIRVRAEYWGGRIGVTYGEPLFADGPLAMDVLPGLGARP